MSDHRLWYTSNKGKNWSPFSGKIPWMSDASLSVGPNHSVWLAGENAGNQIPSLWTFSPSDSKWKQVAVPVPSSWAHHSITVMSPTWQNTGTGLVGIVEKESHYDSVIWDTMADGGKSWKMSSPPLSISGNAWALTGVQGAKVYAMSLSGRLEEWQTQKSWRAVNSHLPSGQPVALDVRPHGNVMLLTDRQATPLLEVLGHHNQWISNSLP